MKHELIKGRYTYDMRKIRAFGNMRVAMLICKGGKRVGMILHHPGANCLTYDGRYWNTPELMDAVRPFLDKKRFYGVWKIFNPLNK